MYIINRYVFVCHSEGYPPTHLQLIALYNVITTRKALASQRSDFDMTYHRILYLRCC